MTRSQAHLTRMGRPQSNGWVPTPPIVPITGITPDTFSAAAAGTVGRTLTLFTAIGGTSPFTWAVVSADGMAVAFNGAALQATADPVAATGLYTPVVKVTDSRGQTFQLAPNVTLT